MSVETEHDEFEAAFNAAVEQDGSEEIEDQQETEEETEEETEQETEEEEAEEETEEEAEEEIDVEALKRERDDYRQKFQSNNGRISAYQRQLAELQESNAHLASQVAKAVDDTGSKSEAREQIAENIANSSWQELAEDMPDVAAAIDKRLAEVVDQRLSTINQKLDPISQNLQQQTIEREKAALTSRHSDWVEVVNSSEFSDWLGQQPEAVQELSASTSAADAAYLLDTFKLQNPTEPTGSNNQTRNRNRLKQSIAAPSKRIARKAAPMDDFDAAFDAAVARDRR